MSVVSFAGVQGGKELHEADVQKDTCGKVHHPKTAWQQEALAITQHRQVQQ